MVTRIVSHLWFAEKAEEAARFYVSVVPNSRLDHVTIVPPELAANAADSIQAIEFTLAGQPFMALTAGPIEPFNHAISFMIECESQGEIDQLWDALSEGGHQERCGWLRDRYGLSWQIVPSQLSTLLGGPDRAAATRAREAMLKMVKFDIAALEQAHRGE